MDMERYDDIIDDLNKNRYNFAFNQGRLGFVMGLHKTKGNPYKYDDENYHLWLMGFNMEANGIKEEEKMEPEIIHDKEKRLKILYDGLANDHIKPFYGSRFFLYGRIGYLEGLKIEDSPHDPAKQAYKDWNKGYRFEKAINCTYTEEEEKEDEMEKRWKVVITYQYVKETETETFYIEELEELQDIVEEGPDWRTIKDIVVTLN